MLTRDACEQAFAQAVKDCDPETRVREALAAEPATGAAILGLAVGKAALAMARGAGPVVRGLIVSPFDDNRMLPAGWILMRAGHPVPDARSIEAGAAAIELVESARPEDALLALISGGASALIEQLREGITLELFVAMTTKAAARGTPIDQLNEIRTHFSTIKGGQLADRCVAPVTTLLVSDVIGDDPFVIGSAPTVSHARPGRFEVIAPMRRFGDAMAAALGAHRIENPVDGDIESVAARLLADTARRPGEILVAWGEPTVRLPEDEHGVGGRAQHLALELAREIRGTDIAAFVAGSDGIDGPTRAAGAFVTSETWDAIAAAGIDPAEALLRCDSTTALAAVDALVITGPTGINHADVIVIG